MYTSFGTLSYEYNYSKYKLIVNVDHEISNFYRSLIPKYLRARPQKFSPHISIVRNETPTNLNSWNKYNGENISFQYDGIIQQNETYLWLNIFSKKLEDIRLELGLEVSSQWTLPPNGFNKCFHMTLSNFKNDL